MLGAAFRAAPSILVGSSQKPRPADLQARERPEPQERLEVPEPDLEARDCLDVGDRGLVVAGLEPLLVPPLVSGEQALTLAQLAEQFVVRRRFGLLAGFGFTAGVTSACGLVARFSVGDARFMSSRG